jgi:alcohol dehydrogenase class IV
MSCNSLRFEFTTAPRIIFGCGAIREIGPLSAEFGKRAMLVTGRDGNRAGALVELLSNAGVTVMQFPVPGEPALDLIREGTSTALREKCDFVIGFGGGSALDAAKAIAAMVANGGDLLDYLDVIGRGKPLSRPSIPCIAIPTTSGTGSEVTRNSVLTSPEHRLKASLRGPYMLPKLALVDPELTRTLPPAITAATGMDALTQLIEPYVCLRANPMTDGICKEGLMRAARSLRSAFDDGNNLAAREEMSVSSLFGGLALANAGLGAVHGFASSIGGMINAPHGDICAALLPHVMAENIRALRTRAPQSPAIQRYDEVAQILTGKSNARADNGVEWVRQLVEHMKIRPLRDYGMKSEYFPVLAEKSTKANSMKANPIVLTHEELISILEQSI